MRAVSRHLPTIPGLVIDALGGEPGIHSARWAGPDKDFRGAMNRIQTLLIERGAKTPEQRRAHFIAALCLAWPDGHVEEFEGRVDGVAVWPPRGDKGFGYDPLFRPDGFDRTFGQMDAEEKHGLPPQGQRPVASRACVHETGGCVSIQALSSVPDRYNFNQLSSSRLPLRWLRSARADYDA